MQGTSAVPVLSLDRAVSEGRRLVPLDRGISESGSRNNDVVCDFGVVLSCSYREIKMRIIDREEPKTIKFETENSPIPFNFWIQLLPTGEFSCKMKLTIKAELNMFIKGMEKKPLQEGIEKIADALAMIPYQD